MTSEEIQEIEKACEASAGPQRDDARAWLRMLLEEVKGLKEELRQAHVDVMDWEASMKSERDSVLDRIAKEREACAKIAIKEAGGDYYAQPVGEAIAEAIRARGKT